MHAAETSTANGNTPKLNMNGRMSMGQKSKIVFTEGEALDLGSYSWDDRRFSNLLVKGNAINPDQAMDVSRFLRKEIAKLELQNITMPIIEHMIEAKFRDFGLSKTSPVRLDKSFFIRQGLDLSDNAIRVLERRYLKRDREGRVVESPEEMFARVAHHIAQAEKRYGGEERIREVEAVFYRLMTEFKFLPNSPTLMNAGRELGQLAACFVLPIEDSMDGILTRLKTQPSSINPEGAPDSHFPG